MASFRKKIKKLGRKVAAVHAKAAKIITPIVAGAATIVLGPAAGAAVAGVAGLAARQAGATAARGKGIKGHAARTEGRDLRKKVIKLGLLGTGIGTVANVGIAAIKGENILHSALGGQVGKQVFDSGPVAAERSFEESAVTEAEMMEQLKGPGQKAAEGGLNLGNLFGLGGETGAKTQEEKDAEAPFGIPKPLLIGGAIVLVLVVLASGSRSSNGSRKAA